MIVHVHCDCQCHESLGCSRAWTPPHSHCVAAHMHPTAPCGTFCRPPSSCRSMLLAPPPAPEIPPEKEAIVFEEIATMDFPFEGIPTVPPRKDMDHMAFFCGGCRWAAVA